MPSPLFSYNRGVCKLHDGVDMITRERVLAIVHNIRSDRYLIIEYKSNQEICFVSGGIEIGHSKEQTVLKELSEETGITNILSIEEKPELYFEVQFYSPHRQKNYHNLTHVFLVTTDQDEISVDAEESLIQTPHRKTITEIQAIIEAGKTDTNYESFEYLIRQINS